MPPSLLWVHEILQPDATIYVKSIRSSNQMPPLYVTSIRSSNQMPPSLLSPWDPPTRYHPYMWRPSDHPTRCHPYIWSPSDPPIRWHPPCCKVHGILQSDATLPAVKSMRSSNLMPPSLLWSPWDVMMLAIILQSDATLAQLRKPGDISHKINKKSTMITVLLCNQRAQNILYMHLDSTALT